MREVFDDWGTIIVGVLVVAGAVVFFRYRAWQEKRKRK